MLRVSWLLPGLLLAGSAAAAPPLLIPSKLDRVLLYSTQARVFRNAALTLTSDSVTAGVADLPSAANEDSVRVECKTAEVQRVEITRTREQLPRQAKAKELADKIEAVLEKLREIRDERQLLDGEVSLVSALQLQRPVPRPGEKTPPEGLFVDAWRRILAWVEARSTKAKARMLVLAGDEKKEQRALHALLVQSKGLNLAAAGQAVPRVLVSLKGRPGRHQVEISYLVSNVRWAPTYDLGYDARSRSVEVATYATVSQWSGEDWNAAEARFSTGRPADLMAVPELPTWTLGRQRDFEPRPRPRPEPPRLVWTPPVFGAAALDATAERLRVALAESQQMVALPEDKGRRVVDTSETRDTAGKKLPPRSTRYEFATTTVTGKLEKPKPAAKQAPPPPPEPSPAKPAATPAPIEAEEQAAETTVVRAEARRGGFSAGAEKPVEEVPWTEEGYRPPPMDRDSPAAAAEGYLYTLYAPGRHTVQANGVAQRVPLSRQRLSIRPVYRIRPGLSQAAYLIASLTNTTGKPILRGHANLFAGAMFTGRSWLNTALPGRKIVLPLGVDDAVQVVRHLRQQTATKGVVFKDDATNYTVSIEIANHHHYPVEVEVEDQVPLKHEREGAKVDVVGFDSRSFSKPDWRGKVSWKGRVAATSVKKLEFSFRIVRPKDWEVQQHDD